MIPRAIHQLWKTEVVPDHVAGYVETWRRFHPGWDYRLWTDADLANLVESRFSEYRDLYHGYRLPIMRADLGRYLVLKAFGGLYADLDAEAAGPFDSLLHSDVPIFADEPPSHARLEFVRRRGFGRIVSNAVIASPPDHAFWDFFLDLMGRCRTASDVLDATGPFVLTAAIEQFRGGDPPRVLPAATFSPFDKDGVAVERTSADVETLARHHWIGSWYKTAPPVASPSPSSSIPGRIRARLARLRHGAQARLARQLPSPEQRFRRTIDRDILNASTPGGTQTLIAVPVLNAAATLDALFASILRLQHPRNELSVAFLVGGSKDDSLAKVRAFQTRHGGDFRRVTVMTEARRSTTYDIRWAPGVQRQRRANIARARNFLLRKTLQDEHWVLWIDADIVDFPADVLGRLRATGARIAHPNAVRRFGGLSMDLNAWVTERRPDDSMLAAWLHDGLYQPPVGYQRLYLSDLHYRDEVLLDSVGGTMLLVDAALHRAGLRFPHRPYRHLIETEAFAAAAGDLGIAVVGLPNLEILHSAN
jgi:hypothetical protein